MPRLLRSPTLLSLAMVVPLLVMAVLSWLGMRAQVRAAWMAAREDVSGVGHVVASDLAKELENSLMPAQIFPDPPVPGTASDADQILDGNDLTALRTLRDDRNAGLSPSGLPRQMLAGFRVMELGGNADDSVRMLELAVADAPSVLSTRAIAQYGSDESRARWQQEERAREILRKMPNLSKEGDWVMSTNVAWLRRDDAILQFLSVESLEKALHNSASILPHWANVRLVANGNLYGDEKGEVLQSVAVPFGADVRMEIIAANPEWIEADARRQGRWTLAILTFAMMVCSAAVLMMQHALRRERQLSDLKSQFVASVSHELRAPVASIRLMAEGLEAGKIEGSMVGDFHRLIARESARLSTMVTNVLDHARIEQGRKTWSMQPCDVKVLTEESMCVMKPLAAEKGIVLEAELAEVTAMVDAGGIQQALVNLLDNAMKFSPPNGLVRVKLAVCDEMVVISVLDQGSGVAEAEKDLIFERFYRSGNELRRETQGTGIGLSLVKSIAEAHDGKVTVETPPQGGSEFFIRFPHKL